VLKLNRGYCWIYNLSFLLVFLVNNTILKEYKVLVYTIVTTIQAYVISAGYKCLLLKRDIKDIFYIVPLFYRARILMGFF
jgi:hypothetical protein